MDINKELKNVFAESKNVPITEKTIPTRLSVADEKINEILDRRESVERFDQEQVYGSITIEMAWFLFCFGIRMATYSLRLSNQRYFTNGLFAISMTLGKLDARDILVILSLYCETQKKTGVSFEEILNENNEFSSILRDFISRDEKDKSLDCMGFYLEIDENGNLSYRRS